MRGRRRIAIPSQDTLPARDAGEVTYHTPEITAVPGIKCVFECDTAKVPHVRYQFQELAALLTRIPESRPSHAISDVCWRTSNSGWHGTANLAEAVRLAREGWHDGARQAVEAATRLQIARPLARRLSRQYGVAGAIPDVARAIAGNPLHMRQIKTREVSGRVVSLVVDISASCTVEAERLMLNAVCAAGICDAMENAGFRVEIIVRSGYIGEIVSDIAIVAKRPEDPLDLGKLAFMCGHSSMLRRFVFGLQCVERRLHGVGVNMGYPCYSLPDAERGLYVVPLPQNNHESSNDVAEIFDGMIAALREQGCPGIPAEM